MYQVLRTHTQTLVSIFSSFFPFLLYFSLVTFCSCVGRLTLDFVCIWKNRLTPAPFRLSGRFPLLIRSKPDRFLGWTFVSAHSTDSPSRFSLPASSLLFINEESCLLVCVCVCVCVTCFHNYEKRKSELGLIHLCDSWSNTHSTLPNPPLLSPLVRLRLHLSLLIFSRPFFHTVFRCFLYQVSIKNEIMLYGFSNTHTHTHTHILGTLYSERWVCFSLFHKMMRIRFNCTSIRLA